ncbi:6773_t:CDS:2, partial [Entrophospora sp. SA101]
MVFTSRKLDLIVSHSNIIITGDRERHPRRMVQLLKMWRSVEEELCEIDVKYLGHDPVHYVWD